MESNACFPQYATGGLTNQNKFKSKVITEIQGAQGSLNLTQAGSKGDVQHVAEIKTRLVSGQKSQKASGPDRGIEGTKEMQVVL